VVGRRGGGGGAGRQGDEVRRIVEAEISHSRRRYTWRGAGPKRGSWWRAAALAGVVLHERLFLAAMPTFSLDLRQHSFCSVMD
jgi:hypothetical protein